MDTEDYIPVAGDVNDMAEKEQEPKPYITTDSPTPRPSQASYHPITPSSPPPYPVRHSPPSYLSGKLTAYTPYQTQHLSAATAAHIITLLWWLINLIIGIILTPGEEDYDQNEHGSSAAFARQLTYFRLSLVGAVPAFLLTWVKAIVLPRVHRGQLQSEESRRLAEDIDINEVYTDDTHHYGQRTELLLGKWWETYVERERLVGILTHLLAFAVTVWLATGHFRGYIRPRGPFDDAICAFSDPRASMGVDNPEA
ncbi:hypothetical protein TWF481_010951 [Arthrobotrys musiformis]|uniref:Uncharacterized protein n=1 Tax=Arthrobotrys musiformis TaxID=47236 RepID=A0AAV9VX24_9PEZI